MSNSGFTEMKFFKDLKMMKIHLLILYSLKNIFSHKLCKFMTIKILMEVLENSGKKDLCP